MPIVLWCEWSTGSLINPAYDCFCIPDRSRLFVFHVLQKYCWWTIRTLMILDLTFRQSKSIAICYLNMLIKSNEMQQYAVWFILMQNHSTVFSTPDDGCGGHPKHVEWFCSKINQTAYCCISLDFINIDLGAYGWGEGCIGSWCGNRREGDHWADLGVDGRIILERISRRWDVCIWTGLGWPRIETGGGCLWVR